MNHFLKTIIFALGISPVFAIDPPPEMARPPESLLRSRASDSAPTKKLPYIGISTSPIHELLREHLQIPQGHGLMIRTICPDSPAEKVGLNTKDIILSVNGEPIGMPETFSEKIRNSQIGESISMEILRKGKNEHIEINLGERPEELQAHLEETPFLETIPQNPTNRLREMMEHSLRNFGFDSLSDGKFEDTIRQMNERLNETFQSEEHPLKEDEGGGIHFQKNSTVRVMDEEGCVEIRSSDSNHKAIVRDSSNQIVWQGPWNSEKDKESAPPKIRERIERIKKSSKDTQSFHFRLGR